MKGFVKDTESILDYGLDWGPWLNGDTISTSQWFVDSGLSVVGGSETADDTKTSLFVSGGAVGEKYVLTNRITTVGQRTCERSFTIFVRER